jgi:hypothetical protein
VVGGWRGVGETIDAKEKADLPSGPVLVFRAVVQGGGTKKRGVIRVWTVLAEPDDNVLFLCPLIQLVARPVRPRHHPGRVTEGNDAMALQGIQKGIVVLVRMRRGRRRDSQPDGHRYRRQRRQRPLCLAVVGLHEANYSPQCQGPRQYRTT